MRIASIILVSFLPSVILANDGWIGNGGSPTLMKGHGSIRMVREVVWLTVGRKHTDVSCAFWFRNEGLATTVRMGFPDEDSGREDGTDSVFEYFHSKVDGKPVKTALVQDPQSLFWHVKTVPFRAGQSHEVRCQYRVKTGGGISVGNTSALEASYTLHTGASWKGSIGRVDVFVTFDKSLPAPARALPFDELVKLDRISKTPDGYARANAEIRRRLSRHLDSVFYSGLGKPRIDGRTLHFTARNLEPTKSNNIYLTFAHKISN